MQYSANTTRRLDPGLIVRKIERASEWSRKPMTARAECIVAALAGTIMFLMFVFVAAIA